MEANNWPWRLIKHHSIKHYTDKFGLGKYSLGNHYAGICQSPQQIFIVEISGSDEHWQLATVHSDQQWDGSHQMLQHYWQQQSFKARHVAIGIPDSQVISSAVAIPATQNEAEIHAYMCLEVAQLSPMDSNQMAMDYHLVSESNQNLYQLYACSQSSIDSLLETTQQAKLIPQVIAPESIAKQYLLSWLSANHSPLNIHHYQSSESAQPYQSEFCIACGLAMMAMHSSNDDNKLWAT